MNYTMPNWRSQAGRELFCNTTNFTEPPITEQTIIVDHLDRKCQALDSLIAEKEALIKDMEAYKKSLIFEVVTGKRKV